MQKPADFDVEVSKATVIPLPGNGADFPKISVPSLAEIMLLQGEGRQWFFNKIPEGAFLITGRPKVGKSWLLFQLAICANNGQSFLDFESLGQFGVLYMAPEDDLVRVQSRCRAYGLDQIPQNIEFMVREQFIALAETYRERFTLVEFLDHYLATHPAIKFVILDTESTCRLIWGNEAARDVSITRKDYAEVSEMDALALRRRVFIGLVNHTRKNTSGKPTIDIHELINRTNTAMAGASGSIVVSEWPGKQTFDGDPDKARVLGIRGRDIIEDVLIVIEQDKQAWFHNKGPFVEVKQTRAQAEILDAVEELGVGVYHSSAEIAKHLGKTTATVQRTVSRMMKEMRIEFKKYRVETKQGSGIRLTT